MTAARDLAATVRRVLDELCDEATLGIDENEGQDAVAATCHEGQVALAALKKRAADAQASERAEKHVARAMRDVMAERDAERARAVRAEEALREIAGLRTASASGEISISTAAQIASDYFAAAGADTPTCICYPGHHDMPGGREPACPAP